MAHTLMLTALLALIALLINYTPAPRTNMAIVLDGYTENLPTDEQREASLGPCRDLLGESK
jgi:hypothetical protein